MKLRKAFLEGVDVITVLDFAGDSTDWETSCAPEL